MKVSYFLKQPTAEKTSLIGRVNWGENQIKFGTEILTSPKFWEKSKQQFKQTNANPGFPELNQRLKQLATDVSKAYNNFQNNEKREPTKDELRQLITPIITSKRRKQERKQKANYISFFDYYLKFIERTKAGTRTRKGQSATTITKDVARVHMVTYNKLKDLNPNLDWQDIDFDFYDLFLGSLKEQGLSTNYIGRQIKNLKAVLNEATDFGMPTNPAFKNRRFAGFQEDVEDVYLNERELQQLFALDLQASPHLDVTRDLFLIGCYTGQRYSDWGKLTPQNIKDGFLNIIQQKGSSIKQKAVALPLHTVVKQIFTKYGGELPKPYSNQKTNNYLKEVCALVPCLHEKVSTTRTQGSQKVTTVEPKYNLIGTHTARRSFATNSFLADIPSITIMAVTGHATEKEFLKYIKLSSVEHAKIYQVRWDKEAESTGKVVAI